MNLSQGAVLTGYAMKGPSQFIPVIGFFATVISTTAFGEVFSVATTDELRSALSYAAQTASSDTIYLAPGTYHTGSEGPFRYEAEGNSDLLLVGDATDPAATVLSTSGATEALVLTNAQPGGTFVLKGLTIVSDGQGLYTENARTQVESTAFFTHANATDPAPEPPAESMMMASNEPDNHARFWWWRGDDDDKKDKDGVEERLLEALRKANGKWVLLGTPEPIRNMKLFDQLGAVWAYQNGKWRAYSARQDVKLRLHEKQIDELKEIPAFSGFWVWRD